MDAAGRMGRGTRQARRMCGLKRRALVSFACVALFVFLALSSLATREDRTGDARLTRAPRLRAHRGDGGTVEGDAWLAEWQRAHGVDARGAHVARAEMLDVREPIVFVADAAQAHHGVVAAGKHHNKRYSLRGSLEASLPLDSDIGSASEEDPALSAALRSMRLTPGSLVALTFADANDARHGSQLERALATRERTAFSGRARRSHREGVSGAGRADVPGVSKERSGR